MDARQQKIFDCVLALVPRHGWTERAFDAGVEQAAVAPAEAHKLFPRGVDDIAEAFHRHIETTMQMRIKSKRNFPALRVRDKIAFAVRARLEAIEDHRDAMQRLLVWAMMPHRMRRAATQLWQAADAIWIAAGDTATDYNYYTKRLLLIAVMKSVLSFWLNDESEGRRETWEFLDRRIADVLTVGKGIGVAKNIGISGIASSLRTRFS